MATLLDTLVVALTLDPTGIVKGQKEAGTAFDKTKEGMVKGCKQIEETTKNATLSVGKLRSMVIELFAAFTAGKGLKDFIADVTTFDASTARLAKTLDMSVESLSAFQGAGKLVGATTEDMNSGIQNLVSNYMSWAIAGKSQILPYMNILGVKMRDVSKDANAAQKEVLELSAALSARDSAYAAEMAHEMGFSPGFTNFLLLGPERIRELMKLQKEYGFITREDAEQAKNLQFNWMALIQVSTSLGRSLMTALTPAMDGILKAFTSLGEWAHQHGEFVKALMFGLAAAATALGLALAAPHALLIAVVAAITALITAGALLYDDWQTWNKGGEATFGHFYDSVAPKLRDIGDLFKKIGKSFKTDFLDVITGAGSSIFDALKKAFETFFGWLRDKFNNIALALGLPLPFPGQAGGTPAGAGSGSGGGSAAAPGGATAGGAAPSPYGDLDVGQRPKDNRNFWQRHAPTWLGGKEAPGTTPQTRGAPSGANADETHANFGGGTFAQKSPAIMARLMKDFGLTKEEASAIMGNLGHESRGFKDMQEIHPRFGRGGLGWAQWTGPRRRAFEAWSKAHGLDPKSDEANYGFLHHELTTNYAKAIRALKNARGNKVVAFEQAYEAAGVKKYESRERYAHIALDAYNHSLSGGSALYPGRTLSSGSPHAAAIHNSAWRAAAAAHHHSHKTSSNSTHIGELHVHSAAKDATGIAKDIKPALSRKLLTTQSDYGPI